MSKFLEVNKGYTIMVKSWENDGDNSATNYMIVDELEEAKAYYDMMQLCVSQNNQPKEVVRLGNAYVTFSNEQVALMDNFLKNNPILFDKEDPYKPEEWEEEEERRDYIVEVFMDLASSLLGNSEDYLCRVMQTCRVTYSPSDIYVDIVEF